MNFLNLFKKFFGKKEKSKLPLAPWELYRTCINCLRSIPKKDNICNECGHDQSISVEKKSASIEEMAEAIVQIACNIPLRQLDIDFINDIAGKTIDEPIINRAINEIIILRAAVSSLLFLKHYENHSKYIIITNELKKQLNELFNNIPEIWKMRMHQYADALEDENPIETISTILQFILEQTITGNDFTELENSMPLKIIAKKWTYPSWSNNMRCGFFVGEFIEFFKIWSNRWEIK